MNFVKCARCGELDLIEAHRSVEFEGDAHELCKVCWEDLRKWFVQLDEGQFISACA